MFQQAVPKGKTIEASSGCSSKPDPSDPGFTWSELERIVPIAYWVDIPKRCDLE
jgi:hypothetical protein